jgi:hypothetical protein
MLPPPHDAEGTVPHDHEEITAEDLLIRYLQFGIHLHFEDGGWRLSSAAFSPSSPRTHPRSSVSVDLEKSMVAAGLSLPYQAKNHSFGVAALKTEAARDQELLVGWDPRDNNSHHCAIWKLANNKSKRAALAKAATIQKLPKE